MARPCADDYVEVRISHDNRRRNLTYLLPYAYLGQGSRQIEPQDLTPGQLRKKSCGPWTRLAFPFIWKVYCYCVDLIGYSPC